jgi:predicted DNA-binding transcriptional regulator AlpA
MTRLISEKEFREGVLGRSAASYWRQKKSGDLPDHVLVGGRTYFTEEAIKAWLEKKTVKPSPDDKVAVGE